jgi:hypothetical protein
MRKYTFLFELKSKMPVSRHINEMAFTVLADHEQFVADLYAQRLAFQNIALVSQAAGFGAVVQLVGRTVKLLSSSGVWRSVAAVAAGIKFL